MFYVVRAISLFELCATSGVPQGTNLGPLLFILFLNDILDDIDSFISMFADDSKLFCRIYSIANCVRLQGALDNFLRWYKTNRLSIDVSECYAMSYTEKNNIILYNCCL